MSEKDFFDKVLLGTTLTDLDIDLDKKTIVIESNGIYGSCFSLDKFIEHNVKFADNIQFSDKFHKEILKNKLVTDEILIEAIPCLLRPDAKYIVEINNSIFRNNIDYVKINNFFFINKNKNLIKIPYTSTEIYESNQFENTLFSKENKLNLLDIYWYTKALKEKNLMLFKNNCSNKKSILYDIFEKKLIDVCLYNSYLIYPQGGTTTICEYLALKMAMKGVVFCLDTTLTPEPVEEEFSTEYKVKYTVSVAELYGKELIQQKLPCGKTYIRVILTEWFKLTGNFVCYLESVISSEIITIYGFNSLTNCTPDKFQLLYFISEVQPISNEDLAHFDIDYKKVNVDMHFVSKTSVSQYNSAINKL